MMTDYDPLFLRCCCSSHNQWWFLVSILVPIFMTDHIILKNPFSHPGVMVFKWFFEQKFLHDKVFSSLWKNRKNKDTYTKTPKHISQFDYFYIYILCISFFPSSHLSWVSVQRFPPVSCSLVHCPVPIHMWIMMGWITGSALPWAASLWSQSTVLSTPSSVPLFSMLWKHQVVAAYPCISPGGSVANNPSQISAA